MILKSLPLKLPILVVVRLLSSSPCVEEGECLAVGPGLQHIPGVASAEECQQLCWERRNTCNYFTFYNQSANYGNNSVLNGFCKKIVRGGDKVHLEEGCSPLTELSCPALSSTCHLFPECELVRDCQGCVTGPASCLETCQLPPPRGGHWYCQPDMRITPTQVKSQGLLNPSRPVLDCVSFTEKCYFLCEEKSLLELTCLSGKWSIDVKHNSERLTCKMRSDIS